MPSPHSSKLAGAVALAAILIASGCDAVLTTAQLPEVKEDRILGQWKDLGTPGSKPEPDPLLIKFDQGQYWAGSADDFAKGKASAFILARVGSTLIAQSASKQCDEFGVEKGKPCFSLNRIQLMGDKMSWYDFDSAQMAKDSISGALNVAHTLHRERRQSGTFENAMLIPVDAPALQQFLTSYVTHRGVFHLTGRLERVH
ncbi:MAG TPA: hypothetical protein VGL53_10375 [Bryobacteraceae bacterium]|jgi:hypothetical protein